MTLSYGTADDGVETDRALCERAVRALAEGHALRAPARIVPVDKETVCAWLDRVARHCRVVSCSPYGTTSTSPNANSTRCGGSCLPKKRLCLGPSSSARPTETPGYGGRLRPWGAWWWLA